MSTSALDPQIHDPERLRVVATLAALPDGLAVQSPMITGVSFTVESLLSVAHLVLR